MERSVVLDLYVHCHNYNNRLCQRIALPGLALVLLVGFIACKGERRSSDQATQEQCQRLASKYASLAAEQMASGPGQDAPEFREAAERLVQAVIADEKRATQKTCLAEFHRDRASCMLSASDLDAMAACPPIVDKRPKTERPTTEQCSQLGAHLETLYVVEDRSSSDPDAIERIASMRKAAKGIVANTVRECGWSLTKDDVACQRKAQSLSELIACAPTRSKLPALESALDEL